MPTLGDFLPASYGTLRSSSSVPISSDAHRGLSELFQNGHLEWSGRFTSACLAATVRQLFHSIWYRSEWLAHFGLEGENIPQVKFLGDWRIADATSERAWSLSEAQKRAETKRRKAGKAPMRVVRRGRTCAKVLQRYEKTYTCR